MASAHAIGAQLSTGAQRETQAPGLPPDLLAQAARRLRIVAILYAFVFFVSDPVTALLFVDDRRAFLTTPLRWAPSALSIAAACLVAALTWARGLPVCAVLAVGVWFEVAGSYGIAAAEYLDSERYSTAPPWAGLSWVAVWMLSFTIMIPTPPRLALSGALVSASAVPVVAGAAILSGAAQPAITLPRFFMHVVLPYLLVVLVAYVGARVVYRLGTQLTQARELGSYRLIRRLGGGGMGEVWQAHHRFLLRPAAIKLIRVDAADGGAASGGFELRARFEREAQATSSLRSPHTIELYDFGITDGGTFYYVMELLDGFDLQSLVERFGPVPAGRAIHLLKQVCHSLAEAHHRGLVHRDIKPANVYVCRYGRDVDFVKVLDFGLVKPQQHAGPTGVDITLADATRGTPAFMPPEQVLGDRRLDGRSDLYAVGCLGYWLVTGRLVFEGRTALETILRHVQATPGPPSARSAFAIPAPYDELILACLAKEPADRPASAEAVAARLGAIEAAEWSCDCAREWWERHHPAARS